MKFLLIIAALLLSIPVVSAQTETPQISISYENSSRQEVISQLEQTSKISFYYNEEWLGDDLVSGVYENASLSEILGDLFEQTTVNFFFLDYRIIVLTQNVVIKDTLHESFYRDSLGSSNQETTEALPFYLAEKESGTSAIETVRIGKQQQAGTQEKFTLSGIVRNSRTGEPIQNLAIIEKKNGKGVSTDIDGRYQIALSAGPNLLQTKALGIESMEKRVIMYNDGQLDFNLEESIEQLDEVIVESNSLKNVETVVTGVVELNVAEIKTIPLVLGERDILKTAITLPGITNAGEGAAGYNVRGGGTDQNLILLDDAVIYNPSHFFGIFSALNPFTTGGVTIYKGSIPAEYGGRLSSVFDINTKDPNTDKFSGEASLGPVTSNLTLEIPIVKEKSGILLGGRSTYSNWILNSLDEESLKNSKASFFDIVAKYSNRLNENNTISATGYYSRDAFSITSDSVYSYSNRLFSLKWNRKLNDKNSMNTMLANSQYGFNIDFEGNSDKNFNLGYRINETELKLKFLKLFRNNHRINYGLSSKLYIVNPGEVEPRGSASIVAPLEIQQEKGWESALFISDNIKLNDKLSVDLGLRYSFYTALGKSSQKIYEEGVPKNEGTLTEIKEFDNNEIIKTYDGLEVRASTRYFLSPSLSVKAGYNNTFQYIHTISSNTTVSPTDTWKLSDINIAPQRANQVSLGFFKNFGDNAYELSLESYYKKSNNILDYKVGAQLLLNESIETEVLQGEGKAYGVELLLKKTEGRLNGWLGYTYSRTFTKLDSDFIEEQINNGDYFPSNFDKPHDISLVTNYKFTKRFSFSANFVYQTGRPVTFPVGSYFLDGAEYALYSDRNKFRIPDFYRLDFSFNIEGNHKIKKFAHSFWNISVYNVLGRNNPYSVFFVTEDGSLKALQSSIFAIPVPTITYNFKF
ncbi:carboxypeptidase-like regulatory domain-containing protein [Maribacter sp. 2307UL18-2]|uniref:TonB-dependent receptor n=1 Tax=Maribacter sp. 2307UL18-2 TaxID=3386274 RepID=UPI0039BC5FD3